MANYDSNTVSVIDTATNTVVATIPMVGGPVAFGLFIGPELACVTPPSDMLSWWPFDEETGTTAHDIAGSYDGTVNGGATWSAGKVAGALSFDGADDYVFVSNTLNIDGGPQATYDAWVFPESVPAVDTYYGIFGAGDSTQPVWQTQQCRLLYWRTASSPANAAKFYMDCGTDNTEPSYISRIYRQ